MAKKKVKAAEVPEPAEERAPESAPAVAPLSAPAACVIPPAANLRVKMLTKAMGPGLNLACGKEYDLDARLAESLVAGGYAMRVASDSARETR